jgi:hypothetical protein
MAMIKKKILVPLAALSILLASNAQAQAMDPATQMACEATLCLATGTRPNECTPSIKKYFSISAKKFKDTLKARKNFLKLCPSTDDAQASQIVNANPPPPDEPDPEPGIPGKPGMHDDQVVAQ